MRTMVPTHGPGLHACIRGPTRITDPQPSAARSHYRKISTAAKMAYVRLLYLPLHALHRSSVHAPSANSAMHVWVIRDVMYVWRG